MAARFAWEFEPSLLPVCLMRVSCQKVVDGRPGYAKPSIDGGKQEEIAVIDPDFE
jgi:hypothetical protein